MIKSSLLLFCMKYIARPKLGLRGGPVATDRIWKSVLSFRPEAFLFSLLSNFKISIDRSDICTFPIKKNPSFVTNDRPLAPSFFISAGIRSLACDLRSCQLWIQCLLAPLATALTFPINLEWMHRKSEHFSHIFSAGKNLSKDDRDMRHPVHTHTGTLVLFFR